MTGSLPPPKQSPARPRRTPEAGVAASLTAAIALEQRKRVAQLGACGPAEGSIPRHHKLFGTAIQEMLRTVNIQCNLRTAVESVWFGDAGAGNFDLAIGGSKVVVRDFFNTIHPQRSGERLQSTHMGHSLAPSDLRQADKSRINTAMRTANTPSENALSRPHLAMRDRDKPYRTMSLGDMAQIRTRGCITFTPQAQ
jgi:hypothetical protein